MNQITITCPECDTPAELPESMQGKEYECTSCCETTIATPAEERKCPKCGGSVKIKATVCKHCKTPLQALLIPGKKTVLQPARQNTAPKLSAAYNTMPASPQGVLTPQKIKKNYKTCSITLFFCLFLGLHVPGILGWICFIVGICAR